jgi:hypothetical protein
MAFRGLLAKLFTPATAKVAGAGAAFAGRRILWPGILLGGTFTSAAWFGAFELVFGAAKLLLPEPAAGRVEARAHYAGIATVPVAGGAVLFAGHRLAPPIAEPSGSVIDLVALVRSLPIRHYATTGLASATAAAVCCRVVQYRGGA